MRAPAIGRRHVLDASAMAFAVVDAGVVIAPAFVLAVTAQKGGLAVVHGVDLLVASGVIGVAHAAVAYGRLAREHRSAIRPLDVWLASLDSLVVLSLAATLLLVVVLGGFAEEHGVLVNEGWPVLALWVGVQLVAVGLAEVTGRAVFRWLERPEGAGTAATERGSMPSTTSPARRGAAPQGGGGEAT